MIEETGRVVAVRDGQAWVQTLRQGACQSCKVRSGCGQRLLTEMSGGRASQVRVTNQSRARVGDSVVIGVPETLLLRASVLVYLVPLLTMMAAALLAAGPLGMSDPWVALCSGLGLAGGFAGIAVYQRCRSDNDQFSPRLQRVLVETSQATPPHGRLATGGSNRGI